MILHVNHTAPHGRLAAPASELVGALLALVEDGSVDTGLLPALRVHLDWIQYRANFREPVSVRRATDAAGAPVALAEIAVDLRQAEPGRFREELARALATLGPDAADDDDRVWVDDWAPMRESIIWRFNRLFWQRLGEWERATGRGFEDALPSGKSDANHPQAVADAVADFWTLLRDMDKHGHLPAEIFALEIGVGSGIRAALWLDRFKALDEERGTGYYPRLRFLLGDYSLPTLDRAHDAVAHHRRRRERPRARRAQPLPHAVVPPLQDPLHPPDQRLRQPAPRRAGAARRAALRGRDARVPAADAAGRIAAAFDVPAADLPRLVSRLLEVGPEVIGDRGAAFWQAVWDAVRLDERLVALDDLSQAPLPAGLDQSHLEDLLTGAPEDVRFHVSRGAAESFVNTLPLLHPRGYLQVQDIFVTAMDEYRHGFRGPGKLDGSVVSWVNGALLRAIGARAGYDVHFAPFRYRPGSRDLHPLHDAARLMAPTGRRDTKAGGEVMSDATLLPTAVVGSYSMPGWLERVKNDYLHRRISRHDLEEIHDAAVKAAIKDQEVAGVDIVSDGELQARQHDRLLRDAPARRADRSRPRSASTTTSTTAWSAPGCPRPPSGSAMIFASCAGSRITGPRCRSPARTRSSSGSGTSTTRARRPSRSTSRAS